MSNKRKATTPATAPDVLDEPLAGGTVAVAYVHKYQIDYSFHHSIVQMVLFDLATSMRVARGGFIVRRGTTGDLARDRNLGVVDFLNDSRQADWLLWVDTDMGFEPDSVERLVASADPLERPVMGGLCFAQREDEDDGVGGHRPLAWPVIMDWDVVNQQGGFSVRWDYPRNAVTLCHGIGSAFVLIHRSVFDKVRDRWEQAEREAGRRKDGDPRWASWYSRIINPSTGELAGEDLSFCIRLMMAEVPVHVDTAVQTTHRKNIWLQEQDYWRQRALAPAPETATNLPREQWTVPRFAVVPTHNRPERLQALVASLGQQCDHIVVLDNASEPPVDEEALRKAAGEAAVTVLCDPEQPPNLSRFWNVMFDLIQSLTFVYKVERYDVAVFNDDAIVPAGWYDICSTVLRGHETAAVAHTGATPVHRHELLDAYPYPREKRMCPWAFVVKGELGLRADESLRWWWQDDDFCRLAIDAGGVLAAPGPLVINAHAVQATAQSPVLADLAEKDRIAFEAKWAGRL